MTPLGSLVTVSDFRSGIHEPFQLGPQHSNQWVAAPGYSSGQVMAAMEEIQPKCYLRNGIRLSDMSYQEKKAQVDKRLFWHVAVVRVLIRGHVELVIAVQCSPVDSGCSSRSLWGLMLQVRRRVFAQIGLVMLIDSPRERHPDRGICKLERQVKPLIGSSGGFVCDCDRS
jgi:hypothetical protein